MNDHAPAFGDVGSWTRLPDGTTGQIWAVYADNQRTRRVWVADGKRYIDVAFDDLIDPDAPPVDAPQGDLFDLIPGEAS